MGFLGPALPYITAATNVAGTAGNLLLRPQQGVGFAANDPAQQQQAMMQAALLQAMQQQQQPIQQQIMGTATPPIDINAIIAALNRGFYGG